MKKGNKKTKEEIAMDAIIEEIQIKECQLTLGVMAVLYTSYFS